MKYFAQFYQNGFMSESGKLVPACGSSGIIRIDGRLNFVNMKEVAAETAKKHGFDAFQIIAGNNLLNTNPIGSMVKL